MIKEIRRIEFIRKFPEVSTYSLWTKANYLEDGTILLDSEWNGEEYLSEGKRYYPVYEWDNIAVKWRIIGYESYERM